MVEKVSDYAIFLLDRDGIIQTWNPAAEAMKGYRADEAVGRNFTMLYTEEDRRRDRPLQNLQHAAKHETFQESAWRQRKDGSLFWALIEIIALRDASGELDGYCKVTRDLTKLKDIQDTLAAEKERAELTLGAIADGVISVDDAGRVTYLNAQAERLTAWRAQDAKGVHIDQVLHLIQPQDHGAAEARLAPADASGTPPRTTQVLCARDGIRHLVETCHSRVQGREGKPGGSVIVFHDVSDRQRMETELRDADRRKDEFLAMLAHELRNPLAPVSAAAELLVLGKLDAASARKASQVIIRQVRHMTELVDDLLDVSRVSRGQITMKMAPLDMKIVVGSAIEQVRPLIESRHHTLAIQLAPARAYVKGDEKRLIQVVSNLLNNAAKYTPHGGAISVDMSVADQVVCLEVADNGVGMEPGIQQSVFELFAQAERTSDRELGGLGIGLSLVRSLTQLHGGSVSCHSEGLGRGSRFKLCFPALEAEAPVPERRSSERLVDLPAPHAGLSVLVVDDNMDAAEMLQFFLSTMGHQVTLAHTASTALEMAQSLRPDACILAIGLPDSSGHDLAMSIRRAVSPPPVLIALTGFGVARDRDWASDAGFDHYFVKPAALDALADVLAGVERRHVDA